MTSAAERVAAAYERMAAVDRPEVWTTVVARESALRAAAEVDARVAGGESLALAGWAVAVKDNIDIAGLPTTAACPAFAYEPGTTAPAVARLVDAGAIVVGKTNLDQFATGLVGTRSPSFGTVANAHLPERIAGGSSSGSAVAVALGIVDAALGTDTAGSGRVPAAANDVVGLKPTRGLVSTRGVVPASPSFDCVSVFSADVDRASRALEVLLGADALDRWARPDRVAPVPVDPRRPPRVGAPDPDSLGLAPAERDAFARALDRARKVGWTLVDWTTDRLEAAGRMLYGSALLAERHASVGAFLASHPDEVDPVVAEVVGRGLGLSADDYIAAWGTLRAHRVAFAHETTDVDLLLVPTISHLPTRAEVGADPIGVNAALGRFASGANLLDLCGAAVPAGVTAEGLPFGVTLLGPALSDLSVGRAAAAFTTDGDPPLPSLPPGATSAPVTVPLAVAGLHLQGQPLNHQLTDRGARLVATTTTAAAYRMVLVAGPPAKPGLVRDDREGRSIEVEVWELAPEQFAEVVAVVPPPLAIGGLELADGTTVPGFLALPAATVDAIDLSACGSWRRYLAEGMPGAAPR